MQPRKPKFLIAASSYSHQSGGVMVLHDLCDALHRLGFEAAIVLFHGGKAPNFQWALSNAPEYFKPGHARTWLAVEHGDQAVRDFLQDGIVIYPDLIPDNPLGASRIVRYLLYKNPGLVSRPGVEYLLSFSTLYHPQADGYLFKPFHDPVFTTEGARHWSQRTMDITYFGKGPVFTDCSRMPGTLVVTRTWPDEKEQLAIVLRHCRYFYTWDSVTATNIDAISCGAVPVLLQDKQVTWAELGAGELGPYPLARMATIDGRATVDLDAPAVDAALLEVQKKIAHYEQTWDERTLAFAHSAAAFFGFEP